MKIVRENMPSKHKKFAMGVIVFFWIIAFTVPYLLFTNAGITVEEHREVREYLCQGERCVRNTTGESLTYEVKNAS